MSDVMVLYLFTRVDALNGITSTWGVLFSLAAIGCILIKFGCRLFVDDTNRNDLEECAKRMTPWATWTVAAAAFFGILYVTVPTQRDMAIIVGGHMAVQAVRSETAQKVYAIVQDMLDEELAKIAKRKEANSKGGK